MNLETPWGVPSFAASLGPQLQEEPHLDKGSQESGYLVGALRDEWVFLEVRRHRDGETRRRGSEMAESCVWRECWVRVGSELSGRGGRAQSIPCVRAPLCGQHGRVAWAEGWDANGSLPPVAVWRLDSKPEAADFDGSGPTATGSHVSRGDGGGQVDEGLGGGGHG